MKEFISNCVKVVTNLLLENKEATFGDYIYFINDFAAAENIKITEKTMEEIKKEVKTSVDESNRIISLFPTLYNGKKATPQNIKNMILSFDESTPNDLYLKDIEKIKILQNKKNLDKICINIMKKLFSKHKINLQDIVEVVEVI